MIRPFRSCCVAALLCALAPAAHAATVYVANNGLDGATCGAKASPCRSITRAIANAVAGDNVVVGPGRYAGETGAPGCNCFVAVNKRVVLTSSDGAASTVIDAERFQVGQNVLVTADRSVVGRPKKGFTVLNAGGAGSTGIRIDADDVTVEGNQVVGTSHAFDPDLDVGLPTAPGVGILVVAGHPTPTLVQGNQVMSWDTGIDASGATSVSKNQVSLNAVGIDVKETSSATGNVVTGNFTGILPQDSSRVAGNAVSGNPFDGIEVSGGFAGTITGNNIVGNGGTYSLNCGLYNLNAVHGLVAANNYWGAATGPGPDPADALCDFPAGLTTATPFATKPFKVKAPILP